MAFVIEWTDNAIEDFERIIAYLELTCSDEIAADFAIKVS
jgi:plasmid stabilization system protein ParE